MNQNDPVLAYRPPRIAMGLILSAGLISVAFPLEMHRNLPLAAAVTGLTGFLIMLRAWWLFKKADTAICPTDETTSLVTHDVFSVSRNPMYLGMMIMLIALGILTGDVAFYVAAIANFAVLNQHFCPYEEARLRQQYGSRFGDYEGRVGRWL